MRRNRHYYRRVNRVLDYIAQHLDGRIFQGVTRETLTATCSVCTWKGPPRS